MDNWLRIDKATPAENGRYLVLYKNPSRVEIAKFVNQEWFAVENGNGQTINAGISHWHPLPDWPKEA
ncbi:hypothetical protein [Psychrobacter sp. DAB_AL43B]|uniref:hypothetical protein n=1 Tax=Psychrobacter sp. DAB_AL43B TaxID=1028416 RepID=UPI0009A6B858|nr:hypothetical protein [Psychrobacter sp. DAB_AL43B]SLJ84483.1 hypothetical protein DABAL43B_1287 [Psychrobacter sp. DAB_AL43B]